MQNLEKVRKYDAAKNNLIRALECKICKEIPTGSKVIVSCCGQLIGCRECLVRSLQENLSCPLCRADNPRSTEVNGLDVFYDFITI